MIISEQHPEQGPSSILRNTLPSLPVGVIAHLPERENMKKSMRTARRRNLPSNPKTITELGYIPERFRLTLTGDRFLLRDSNDVGGIEGRVIVFSTRRNIEMLGQSDV